MGNPWFEHLSKVRKANPGKSLKDAMILAKKTYNKIGTKSNKPKSKTSRKTKMSSKTSRKTKMSSKSRSKSKASRKTRKR